MNCVIFLLEVPGINVLVNTFLDIIFGNKMDENQKETKRKLIVQLNEDIKNTKSFHEKIGYDIEYNLMKNQKILESEYVTEKDREFFIRQRQNVLKIRESEESDFEEYTRNVNKKIDNYKEEIEELERKEKQESKEEKHDNN